MNFFCSSLKEYTSKLINDLIISVCETAHLGLSAVEDLSIRELVEYYQNLAERQQRAEEARDRASGKHEIGMPMYGGR
jgi:hypothetical protein